MSSATDLDRKLLARTGTHQRGAIATVGLRQGGVAVRDRLAELDTEIRALERRLRALVTDSGTTLTEIHGVGVLLAARILGEASSSLKGT